MHPYARDLGTRAGNRNHRGNLTEIGADGCPALFSVSYNRGAPLDNVPRGGQASADECHHFQLRPVPLLFAAVTSAARCAWHFILISFPRRK
jgi:hypothetical protein